MIFSEKDYNIHKYIALDIIEKVKPISARLEKEILSQNEKVNKLNNFIINCNDIEIINKKSKEIEIEKDKLIKLLAVAIAMDSIITKNLDRIAFIDDEMKSEAIYDFKVDKKELKTIVSQINDISLSQKDIFNDPTLSDKYRLFCKGLILEIVEGRLSFSNENNQEVLKIYPNEVLEIAMKLFPESIVTIPANLFFDVSLKKKVLRQIAYFVSDRIAKMNLEQINNLLGGILNLSLEVPNSIIEYVYEIENMYNVEILKILKAENITNEDENKFIELKCNPKSKYLY